MGKKPESRSEDNSESTKDANVEKTTPKQIPAVVSATNTVLSTSAREGHMMYMIVPVFVSHESNPEHEVAAYAMIDNQSNTTYMLEELRDKLRVAGERVDLLMSTMTLTKEEVVTDKVYGLRARGYRSGDIMKLPPAYVRPSVPTDRSHIPTDETAKRWPHLQHIANKLLPLLDIDISLLIGYNCTAALDLLERIPSAHNGPFALKTVLGWSIIGESRDKNHAICYRTITEASNNLWQRKCLR